jgi:hypothetical protein
MQRNHKLGTHLQHNLLLECSENNVGKLLLANIFKIFTTQFPETKNIEYHDAS